jgi:hypothetical protein
MDFFATAATACLGTETDRTARIDPSSGAPFNPSNPGDDPVNHGPIMAILGQSAQPSNASMFRGLVALDIRNYASMGTREYYNGIAPGTVPESIRASQADYIRKGGYPGPDMPTPTDPPAPENQVGIMSGSAAGQTIAELDQTYNPGDEILAMVYPGYVQEVPQFTMTAPTQVSLPTTGSQTAPVPFKVARNQAFAGTVTLSTESDPGDSQNPMEAGRMGSPPFSYTPNSFTPATNGTTVNIGNGTTTGATAGIYTLWVKGTPSGVGSTTRREPFPVKVGTVTRDFTLTSDQTYKLAATRGDTVTFTLRLEQVPRTTSFGGPNNNCPGSGTGSICLTVDTPLPGGAVNSDVTITPTKLTPSSPAATATLTINTGRMALGLHTFVVRASGQNGDTTLPGLLPVPKKVTHLLPLQVQVEPPPATSDNVYVDIVGYAVMRITELDRPRSIAYAYAVSPVIRDLADPVLKRGRKARLIPW